LDTEPQPVAFAALHRGGAYLGRSAAGALFRRLHTPPDGFEVRAPAAAAADVGLPAVAPALQPTARLHSRTVGTLCLSALAVELGARSVVNLCALMGPLPLPEASRSCARLWAGPLFGTVVGVALAPGLLSYAYSAGQRRATADTLRNLLDGCAVSGTLMYRLGACLVYGEPAAAALRTGLCELGIRNVVYGKNWLAQGRLGSTTACVVKACAVEVLGTCITGAIVGLLPDFVLFRGLGLSFLVLGANSFYSTALFQWQQATHVGDGRTQG
jgi:hypothetical protein